LGYKITYFLDKFEYYRRSNSFIYQGNIIFNEGVTAAETKRALFERKRKHAYLGSRMHFFRTLWENDLASSGFTVENSSHENLVYNNIVIQADGGKKFLKYFENLGVGYFSSKAISTIVFLKDRVYFDDKGYFDQSGISWEGNMAKQRVADILPYEYLIR
jgi:hypothetical protein